MTLLYLAFVTAFASFLAAVGALLSATAAKRASQGSLCSLLLKQYSDEQMHKDLHQVGKVKDNYSDDKSDESKEHWIYKVFLINRQKEEPKNECYKLNLSRRRITHYYTIAFDLYNLKCINKKIFQLICKGEGFILLYDFILDLEFAIQVDLKKDKRDEEIEAEQYFKILDICGLKDKEEMRKALQIKLKKAEQRLQEKKANKLEYSEKSKSNNHNNQSPEKTSTPDIPPA